MRHHTQRRAAPGKPAQKHECPVSGCRVLIPKKFAMCRPHWRQLADDWKDRIYDSLADNGPGTAAHIETISAAAKTLSPEAVPQEATPAGSPPAQPPYREGLLKVSVNGMSIEQFDTTIGKHGRCAACAKPFTNGFQLAVTQTRPTWEHPLAALPGLPFDSAVGTMCPDCVQANKLPAEVIELVKTGEEFSLNFHAIEVATEAGETQGPTEQ